MSGTALGPHSEQLQLHVDPSADSCLRRVALQPFLPSVPKDHSPTLLPWPQSPAVSRS